MANEHIARLQSIGLGKETTAGTAVAATDWIPKMKGVFTPVVTKAKDESAYGTIDQLRDSVTVKQLTNVEIEGIARDQYIGNLLKAALGTAYITREMALTSVSGTFQVGETVTGGTSSATGVIRRIEDSGDRLYVEVSSGTFAASESITGGTSSATATAAHDTGVYAHVFARLNTNNHPSYTLYGDDPVQDYRAAYCMLDTLDIEVEVGNFAKVMAKFTGKKDSTTTSSPSFSTDENRFMAAHANVYFAADLDSLDGASATKMERVKVTIEKNLEDYQALGSDDADSIHNKQFYVSGDLTALFNSTTLRDYVTASTKKAMRIEVINTDATIGSAENPDLRIDIAQVSFEEWTRSDDNDGLVKQTMGFSAEFDIAEGESVAAVLLNTRSTVY